MAIAVITKVSLDWVIPPARIAERELAVKPNGHAETLGAILVLVGNGKEILWGATSFYPSTAVP